MLRNYTHVLIILALVQVSGAKEAARAAGPPDGCSAEQGQLYIYQGRYKDAVREFTCVIESDPAAMEGYRGRMEAQVLLGDYADAYRNYADMVAYVIPANPLAEKEIWKHYADRLGVDPDDTLALTGLSFARWCFFDYGSAIQHLNRLLVLKPGDLFGHLFRGSSRLLRGASRAEGIEDLEKAILIAPKSPDVHYIVADAYTYGAAPDPERAYVEAMEAYAGGLKTPRVHAILASSYLAFCDAQNAALHIQAHIELVTTDLVATTPLDAGDSMTVALVPGRTYAIPVTAAAGETLSIITNSHDFWDTILVLLGPDGSPILGSDDYIGYFAGFEWVAQAGGTFIVVVTSFEAVNTGDMIVSRG